MSKHPLAVVTGANQGIGYHIAEQLAFAGVQVVMACRDTTKGDAALGQLKKSQTSAKSAQFVEPVVAQIDLEDPKSFTAFTQWLTTRFPNQKVDALINNAAVLIDTASVAPFNKWNLVEKANFTLKINYYNTLELTDQMMPLIKEQGGRIVMLSSAGGQLEVIPSPDIRKRFLSSKLTPAGVGELTTEYLNAVASGLHEKYGWPGKESWAQSYCTSKALLNAYVRTAAPALFAKHGIALVTCSPGWCQTRMGGSGAPRTPAQGADTPAWLSGLLKDSPAPEAVVGRFFSDRKELEW